MIGSRLALRVPDATVDVYTKDTAGDLSSTATYADIPAMHQETEAAEISGIFGEITTDVTDLFVIERLVDTGALPVIVEEHVIVFDSVNYEVIRSVDQGGLTERLAVVTKRVR
jgi:hypothetical protein